MTTSITKRIVGVLAAVALALGISAFGTTPASAAGTVWDRVASCESGNRWNINTGNGYYGGLQFSPSTWRAYGGKKYASQANQASKAEQIAIARRVLAGQGPRAWPVCSIRAGLTKANGKADRNAVPSTNPGAKSTPKKSTPKKSTPKKSTPKKAPSNAKYVKVKSGDTLSKIAARYHVKGGWKGLWNLNKSQVKNPNFLRIGWTLRIK